MKDFSKQLESQRPAELKIKEGEEISEEKKVQIAMRNQEESIAKIKEVERLLKEATKFKFNTNVFK